MRSFGALVNKRLLNDRCGVSSVEFALVCGLFFVFVFGLIDFGRAMWEWNAAAKATYRGVRYAVVNDVVSVDLRDFRCAAQGLGSAGDTIPVKDGSGADIFGPIYCSASNGTPGCGPDMSSLSSSKADPDAFNKIFEKMAAIYDRIELDNVVVEYRHIGLGFCGKPPTHGPEIEPATTVRLRGMVFNFVTPGLSGIADMDMPGFDATLTAEDQNTI